MDRPEVLSEPGSDEWLLNACLFLTRTAELLWEDDLRLLECGIERRAASAQLRESAEVFDLCLALQAKVHGLITRPETTLKAPEESAEMLQRRIDHLKKIRTQLTEFLGWLDAPRPPIDPSQIPNEGVTFVPFDKLLDAL